jgi:hypothetical protein
MNGRFEILVSCLAEDHSQARIERLGMPGRTGTFVFTADRLAGPYAAAADPIASPGGPLGTLYAGKLLEAEEDSRRLMASAATATATSSGELTDPLPVLSEADGRIVVTYPHAGDGR